MIILILFAVLVGGFALYHAIRYITGSKKNRIFFADGVLVVIAVALISRACFCEISMHGDEEKYAHAQGALSSETLTDSENNEYYLITSNGNFDNFVVKKSDAELSKMCTLLGDVRVYYIGVEEVRVNETTRYRVKNVAKISPDYYGMYISFTLITAQIFIVFNVVMLIAAAVAKRSETAGKQNILTTDS